MAFKKASSKLPGPNFQHDMHPEALLTARLKQESDKTSRKYIV